jgi:hypothetical protein
MVRVRMPVEVLERSNCLSARPARRSASAASTCPWRRARALPPVHRRPSCVCQTPAHGVKLVLRQRSGVNHGHELHVHVHVHVHVRKGAAISSGHARFTQSAEILGTETHSWLKKDQEGHLAAASVARCAIYGRPGPSGAPCHSPMGHMRRPKQYCMTNHERIQLVAVSRCHLYQ